MPQWPQLFTGTFSLPHFMLPPGMGHEEGSVTDPPLVLVGGVPILVMTMFDA